jgi:hypothetical protein
MTRHINGNRSEETGLNRIIRMSSGNLDLKPGT